MAKSENAHYVNNKEFLQAIIDWKQSVADAEEVGDSPPPVTNYIGECFVKIATHLSYKPNFINYTYRDEMISDGIENCLQYVNNFNPEKSSNPFAYFTQIIYYAFLRRIQKEKKQQHVKNEMIKNSALDTYVTHELDGQDHGSEALEYLQQNMVPDEDVYKPKKKKVQPKGLEKFYDEDGVEINEDSTGN